MANGSPESSRSEPDLKTLVRLKKKLADVKGNPGSSWQEIAQVQDEVLAAAAGLMKGALGLLEQQNVEIDLLERQVEHLTELCLARGWKYQGDTKGKETKAD
jgi:hypothetical protein